MPKSYRIRTQVGQDKFINVKLDQDFEQLEILSLKINESEIYTRVCSDYGVIVGRVLVNGGFGIPNAKISVFVPLSDEDETNPIISELYPYKKISDTNEEGYRYNLLPKEPSYSSHAATGTFPTREEVLLDQSYIEVYDKYYKYTVKTNDSGDYMIFGVPTGTQTIVMDVDLSDIGCFSLSPQDLVDLGLANPSQVNGNTFKTSTNLNELPQIKSLIEIVEVPPFWGDEDICQFGITRVDFDLSKEANIKIEPSAIFMGSIISTNDDDALKTNCKPKNNTGNLCELVTGPGQILAIRQTIFPDQNNLPILEEYKFEENGKVIDGDGSFLVKVPMNIDYVVTNEFGQQVISNDPKKGIPTKGKYRFKFKWENEQGLQNEFLRANFLVPNIKEHGWLTSLQDPFDPSSTTPLSITIPAGLITGSTITIPSNGGLLFDDSVNSSDFSVQINGTPYFGDTTVIPITAGDQIQIISNPTDNTQPQTINYTFLPQGYFDVLRSYSFSLDWDDYVDVQGAINCEDTFYEFNYNKVYTTAMFLDRYKNGIGRAKHLGIKEIDNRTCKTTVNTFPVNDAVRNFDIIFFVFNMLINILSIPIIVLLFLAHLVLFIWPILKYLLIVLGIYFAYDAARDLLDWINSGIENGAFSPLGGPVVNIGLYFRIAAQAASFAFRFAFATAFTIFTLTYLIRIKNFPRIGLPMLSYPECTTCDCDCGNATLDDDITPESVNALVEDQQNIDSTATVVQSQANSFLAPINLSQSFNIQHPNYENPSDVDVDDNNDGPFNNRAGSSGYPQPPYFDCGFKTLLAAAVDQDIKPPVVARAVVDFRRMFSGYDIVSSSGTVGEDVIFSNEGYLRKAPQPFILAAEDNSGTDPRSWAYPIKESYPQILNEFNTRDKYFSGVNKIRTTVNPASGNTFYEDQVVVVLANPGTKDLLGAGKLFSFQNPNMSNCQINLTGSTSNQFGNNAITGSTVTGNTSVNISYAVSQTTNTTIPVLITQQSNSLETFLQYPTDIEYFQMITGFTVNYFNTISQNNTNYFPNTYLKHEIQFRYCCNSNYQPTSSPFFNLGPAINSLTNGPDYEVLIFVRGVDPNTSKQTIKYDISKILGYTTWGNIEIQGSYFMNIPIQGLNVGTAPKSHNTVNNTINGLYFQSYTFSIGNDYTGFTSDLPYYYLSTDDPISSTYQPFSTWGTTNNPQISQNSYQNTNLSPYLLRAGFPKYYGGGTFIASKSASFASCSGNGWNSNTPDNGDEGKNQIGNPPNRLFMVYSPAYIRQSLGGVNFSDKTRIVMRSDRLPLSTNREDGLDSETSYALHQNNNFTYYTADGQQSASSTGLASSLPSGEAADTASGITSIASTLSCEGLIPLTCYSGSGTNVGVRPPGDCVRTFANGEQKEISNRVVRGCYCLLNKVYLFEVNEDIFYFLEWKTRFTITFAACRGIFAQTFQNNWINGTLYMFNFNKTASYQLNNPTDPTYNYCTDVIVYNDINNGFYYRSSPWNESSQEFVGKQPPTFSSIINLPSSVLNDYPGLGYNTKQLQFPTTITDLGPREKFISEICNSDNFNSYFVDNVKSTSYQDLSDVIQIGFLSRLLNENFRQSILPITNPTGGNTEGKGIIQFFNSNRQGDRIDGDFAQMFSINSEWKISPFIVENYPNTNSIFFGDDTQSGQGFPRPVFGIFYETTQINSAYRQNLTPGYETLNYSPLLQYYYGYPKTQEVPFYKWKIESQSNNIFGNENNNWDTVAPFYKRGYQDLDFTNPNEYFQTPTTSLGYLTNFDSSGNPLTTPNYSGSYIVGAPFHFYFGLNNGKTAIDKFVKLYITTEG
jgi:hypothetical protein